MEKTKNPTDEKEITKTKVPMSENHGDRIFSRFLGQFLEKTFLEKVLDKKLITVLKQGIIYPQKYPHNFFMPYSIGWPVDAILEKPFESGFYKYANIKNFENFFDFLLDFLHFAASESTYLQAFSALDLYLAPYIRRDSMDPNSIKKILYRFIYHLNSMFEFRKRNIPISLLLFFNVSDRFLENETFINGNKVGYFGDFLEEASIFLKSLLSILTSGDVIGRPFSQPLVSLFISKNFDWNGQEYGDLSEYIFNAIARAGSLHLINNYHLDINGLYFIYRDFIRNQENFGSIKELHEELFERLKRIKLPKGLWDLPEYSGCFTSLGINIPHLALISNGDFDIFSDNLIDILEKGRYLSRMLTKRYKRMLDEGKLKLIKRYIGTFVGFFNSFCIFGLPEASANFINNPKLWFDGSKEDYKDAISFEKKVLLLIRKVLAEFEDRDHVIYKIEQPTDTMSCQRSAIIDYKIFIDKIKSKDIFIPIKNGIPFYSSAVTPYYTNMPLVYRLYFESEIQQLFTGGVNTQIFLGELPDLKALKNFLYRIIVNIGVISITITPVISICPKCSWKSIGVFNKCPNCDFKNPEIWSRIDGRYRLLHSCPKEQKAEAESIVLYSYEGKTTIEL